MDTPLYCAALNCRNKIGDVDGNEQLSFFKFPNAPERSKKWVVACNRTDLLSKSSKYMHDNFKICSQHFEATMFVDDFKKRLYAYAIPSIFDGSNELETTVFGKRPIEEEDQFGKKMKTRDSKNEVIFDKMTALFVRHAKSASLQKVPFVEQNKQLAQNKGAGKVHVITSDESKVIHEVLVTKDMSQNIGVAQRKKYNTSNVVISAKLPTTSDGSMNSDMMQKVPVAHNIQSTHRKDDTGTEDVRVVTADTYEVICEVSVRKDVAQNINSTQKRGIENKSAALGGKIVTNNNLVQCATAKPPVATLPQQKNHMTAKIIKLQRLVRTLQQRCRRLQVRAMKKKKPEVNNDEFYDLCYEHLPSKLCRFVHMFRGNQKCVTPMANGLRYNAEVKMFGSCLYKMSPQAFTFVKNFVPLPSRKALIKISKCPKSTDSKILEGQDNSS